MELHKGKANEKTGGFLNKKKRGLTKKKQYEERTIFYMCETT